PVLFVDEGRAWLGLEPAAEQEADTEAQDYQTMDAEATADDQAEQDAEQAQPSKALRATDGRFHPLPGTAKRTTERAFLLSAHHDTRQETRTRHYAERMQMKGRHSVERAGAADAKTRMKMAQRHRGELSTLKGRQASERMMLRSIHGAERSRL